MSFSRWTAAAVTGAALATTLSTPSANAAPVSSDGKGIIGLALLGGEAVTAVEAAAGVHEGWAYAVGGGIGIVAGGVGGYFIEQEMSPRVNMYLFTTGIILVIPTTVAILSATAYNAPADYTQDGGPSDEPVAEPPRPEAGAPGASAPAAAKTYVRPRRKASLYTQPATPIAPVKLTPPSVLALSSGNLWLSVPSLEVRNVFSRKDLSDFGVQQRTEYRIPVFAATF